MIVWKIIKNVVRWGIAFFLASTVLAVVVYRFVPVYVTPLMVIRCVQQVTSGEIPVMYHHWVPLTEMSPSMPVAVIASEDARFMKHHGFDMKAIQQAAEYNKTHDRKHGASTISQQTAKNVFLWPARSWVRKGLESYFTVLIEIMWPKERIMEVYLNSIEMGDGIYGVYSVAKHNFGKTPDELSRSECALIAATLPNPRKYSSKDPGSYVRKRQRAIERNMKFVKEF